MELLQSIFDLVVDAARRVWSGVLGAALLGYLASGYGAPVFLLFAAAGAFAGTLIGVWSGVAPICGPTGIAKTDIAISAGGALLLVGTGYFLFQFLMILAVIGAIGLAAAAWLAG